MRSKLRCTLGNAHIPLRGASGRDAPGRTSFRFTSSQSPKMMWAYRNRFSILGQFGSLLAVAANFHSNCTPAVVPIPLPHQ